MLLIQQLKDASYQQQKLVLPDGSTVLLKIQYKPMQFGWFIESLTYGDFIAKGLRICVSPNMLHQFRNLIPFGIACASTNNREPSLREDFLSGNVKLYLLTEAEILAYERYLSGQALS